VSFKPCNKVGASSRQGRVRSLSSASSSLRIARFGKSLLADVLDFGVNVRTPAQACAHLWPKKLRREWPGPLIQSFALPRRERVRSMVCNASRCVALLHRSLGHIEIGHGVINREWRPQAPTISLRVLRTSNKSIPSSMTMDR